VDLQLAGSNGFLLVTRQLGMGISSTLACQVVVDSSIEIMTVSDGNCLGKIQSTVQPRHAM